MNKKKKKSLFPKILLISLVILLTKIIMTHNEVINIITDTLFF